VPVGQRRVAVAVAGHEVDRAHHVFHARQAIRGVRKVAAVDVVDGPVAVVVKPRAIAVYFAVAVAHPLQIV